MTFRASLQPGLQGLVAPRAAARPNARLDNTGHGRLRRPALHSVLPGVHNHGQQDRLDWPRRRARARALGRPRPDRPAGRFRQRGVGHTENRRWGRIERGPDEAQGDAEQATGAGDRRTCAPGARDPQSKLSGRGTCVRTRICARTRTGSLAARTGVFIRVNRELFSHEQGIFLALRGISQPGRHGYRRFSFDAERSPSARCRDPRCPPDSARPCRASKQGATVRRCRGGKRARRPCPRIRNEAQPAVQV